MVAIVAGCHVARLSLFSMPAGHDARTPAGRNAETSRDRERTAPPLEVRADHPTPNITAVHPPHPGHSTSDKPPSTTTCMHRTPPIGRPVTEPPPTDMTRDALLHHPHKIPSTKAPGCPAGSCVLGSPRSLARSNPPPPFFGLCTKIVPTAVRTRHLLLPSLTT